MVGDSQILHKMRLQHIDKILLVRPELVQVSALDFTQPDITLGILELTPYFYASIYTKVYFASRLDVPHYQMPSGQMKTYCSQVERMCPTLSFETFNDSTKNYGGDFLNVCNCPSREIESAMECVDLLAIAEFVLHNGASDGQRKNKYCDIGYASDLNTSRSFASSGISKPRTLEFTDNSLLQSGAVGLSKLVDEVSPPHLKGITYRDPVREAEFSQTIAPLNILDAIRFALTNEDHVLGIHEDTKNCTKTAFRGVINYSRWLTLSDGRWWRLSILGYSRKSITGYMARKSKYGPVIAAVVKFTRSLPFDRLHVSESLLFLPGNRQAMKHVAPHANKSVYLSVYVHCIERLRSTLELTVWHLLALAYNVVDSESPIYFVNVTKAIISRCDKVSSSEASRMFCLAKPSRFGVIFYNMLFNLKDERAALPKKGKVVGQRHQPHNNTRIPEWKVDVSIQNIFCLYLGLNQLESKQVADCHFYGKAVARLEQDVEHGGAYGAGPLTAQHVIGVGCLLGLFPIGLMEHAEIGSSTATYRYLVSEYGFDNHLEDTRQLLECLSTVLELPFFICENLVCKWTQVVPKSTASQPKMCAYTDTILQGQDIYYASASLELMKISATQGTQQVRLTSANKCRVDSKLESNASRDHSLAPGALWQVRFQAGRKVFPMKSATRRFTNNKNNKGKKRSAEVAETGDSNRIMHSIVPPALNLKLREYPTQESVLQKNPATPSQPFRMQKLAMLALKSTVSSHTSFFLYQRFNLCGYTFLHCCLRLSEEEDDIWSPSGPHLGLVPKDDSILVDGRRYFYKKDVAQRYSMLCAIFRQDSAFFRDNWLQEYLPMKHDRHVDADENSKAKVLPKQVTMLRRYSVLYDPTCNPKSERKNRPPFLGILEYSDGAVGVRLLESDGRWVVKSHLHLL
jgi:hypothetical protein